jgi:CBS domain-containing protein
MLVREMMTHEPVTVSRETGLKDAMRLLDAHSITSMPVVEPTGRIVGVVSEADLVRTCVHPDGRAHMIPVAADVAPHGRPSSTADVMNRHPVTVEGDLDVADAVHLMSSASVKSLPVVDRTDRVVGMLSRRDIVHLLARGDELIGQDLATLLGSMGGDWLSEVHDGAVTVDGPVGVKEWSLAATAAWTVPGVMSVTVLE